jgi:hypothetical protein
VFIEWHSLHCLFINCRIFRQITRALSIHQKFKIRKKNDHARYTVEYFPVDNARLIYTKGINSYIMNMRGMGCALYIRCALYIHQKECRKSLGARYLPENTVIYFFLRCNVRTSLVNQIKSCSDKGKTNSHFTPKHAICCFRLSHYPPPHSHRCY